MADTTAVEKTVVLITGANSGIGFELAAQLLSDPTKHVLLGSRSVNKGEVAFGDLQSRDLPGSLELLQLDVADESSISAATNMIQNRHGRLDVIVNNAAIGSTTSSDSPAERMAQCFQTNATGPYLLVEAFGPLLKTSRGTARIINVSPGGGSVTRRLDPKSTSHKIGMWGLPYCASKAALNLITAAQSCVYGEQGMKVFAYSPGFTVSNSGPHNKAENGAHPTSEGAAPIVKILNGERDEEHCGFLSATGQYTW